MDWVLVMLTGFFGSMHCAGMCGAIVAAYSTQDGLPGLPHAGKWTMLYRHLSYNAGRVLSYVLVGVLLGAIGGSFAGLRTIGVWFSTVMGVLLIFSGFWMLKIFPWMGFTQQIDLGGKRISPLISFYSRTYGALLSSPTIESKFYIGLLTPLLPCGFLYSAFAMAAGSGSAVNGAVTMALFGSGIVPALLVVGYVSTFFKFKLRLLGNRLAAVTIVLMGIMMLLRGLGMPLPWMMMGGGHHH